MGSQGVKARTQADKAAHTLLSGYVAEKLCPDFTKLAAKPDTVICVTGTNGKTTVCTMLSDFFRSRGYRVMSNNGYNISTGIAAAICDSTTIFGRLKAGVGIFEIDEKTSPRLIDLLRPNYFICTNLFRDSMKRNGHIEYIRDIIKSGVRDDMKLILNGDDIVSSAIGDGKDAVYFGISRLRTDYSEPHNLVSDVVYCPKCYARLKYDYVRYYHIGHIHCPNCGFSSPDPDYIGKIDEENMSLTINGEPYPIPVYSIFNIYNVLSVAATLCEIGFDHRDIAETLKTLKIDDSRYTCDVIGDRKLIFHMSKGQNSVACSIVFDFVKNYEGSKAVMLMLDDVLDNRDESETISWLYDCDFEFLNDPSIKQIIVGGARALDYRVRLLLAGVDESRISRLTVRWKCRTASSWTA